MENLLWLVAWHGAALTFAVFWTSPLWRRTSPMIHGFVTNDGERFRAVRVPGGWRVIEEK
jgi:hypothetical protein